MWAAMATAAAESQRYFAQVADDIAHACGTGELRCTDPPIGPLPAQPHQRAQAGVVDP